MSKVADGHSVIPKQALSNCTGGWTISQGALRHPTPVSSLNLLLMTLHLEAWLQIIQFLDDIYHLVAVTSPATLLVSEEPRLSRALRASPNNLSVMNHDIGMENEIPLHTWFTIPAV